MLMYGVSFGSGNTFTAFVVGSTRTTAFWPLSVTHAAPSGPVLIVALVAITSSIKGFGSISPPLVVTLGLRSSICISSGGVRKAITALSP